MTRSVGRLEILGNLSYPFDKLYHLEQRASTQGNQSPNILVTGEDSGFVASLDYLISQTRVRIGGKIASFPPK